MIISLTTSFPTFSFRALISPSLTIIISFLTTAEVKETKRQSFAPQLPARSYKPHAP